MDSWPRARGVPPLNAAGTAQRAIPTFVLPRPAGTVMRDIRAKTLAALRRELRIQPDMAKSRRPLGPTIPLLDVTFSKGPRRTRKKSRRHSHALLFLALVLFLVPSRIVCGSDVATKPAEAGR